MRREREKQTVCERDCVCEREEDRKKLFVCVRKQERETEKESGKERQRLREK